MDESNENVPDNKTPVSTPQTMRWLWPLLMGILLFCVIIYFWKGCGNPGASYSKQDSAKMMDSMNNEAVNAVMTPDTSKNDSNRKAK